MLRPRHLPNSPIPSPSHTYPTWSILLDTQTFVIKKKNKTTKRHSSIIPTLTYLHIKKKKVANQEPRFLLLQQLQNLDFWSCDFGVPGRFRTRLLRKEPGWNSRVFRSLGPLEKMGSLYCICCEASKPKTYLFKKLEAWSVMILHKYPLTIQEAFRINLITWASQTIQNCCRSQLLPQALQLTFAGLDQGDTLWGFWLQRSRLTRRLNGTVNIFTRTLFNASKHWLLHKPSGFFLHSLSR